MSIYTCICAIHICASVSPLLEASREHPCCNSLLMFHLMPSHTRKLEGSLTPPALSHFLILLLLSIFTTFLRYPTRESSTFLETDIRAIRVLLSSLWMGWNASDKNESFYISLINHFDSEMSKSVREKDWFTTPSMYSSMYIASCIYAVTELPPRVYVGGRDGCQFVFILLSSYSRSLGACCQVATSY